MVSPVRAHWLARLALVAMAAAAALVLVVAGLRGSVGLILIGLAGVAVGLAGAWWFLTHRGWKRWLAAVLVVIAPIGVMVLFAFANLIWVVVAFGLLWAGGFALGKRALARPHSLAQERETPPPNHPFLIMNPRSGGGKVGKFHLAEKAAELGVPVFLLDGAKIVDVAAVAQKAVEDGADMLGVAGGDGTQALVAAVAAEHGLPFLVISAGTRNHFARDLGLDLEDPATCLDALSDGVELIVDLGRAGDRVFVNNASFGAYAEVVQRPSYRAEKLRTALDTLPDVLAGEQAMRLRLVTEERTVAGAATVLISNNPYTRSGHRARIDSGRLGVVAVTGPRSVFAGEVLEAVVHANREAVPVGIDGEALVMPAPVRCVIHPGALRVRVPRDRPGLRAPAPELDWKRLWGLAKPDRRDQEAKEQVTVRPVNQPLEPK
jgi:diacylglycerol kinase family enzyme